jgi:hypothetical protein
MIYNYHLIYQGLTAITGKWASDFSERLKIGGLSCKILNKSDFTVSMVVTEV